MMRMAYKLNCHTTYRPLREKEGKGMGREGEGEGRGRERGEEGGGEREGRKAGEL